MRNGISLLYIEDNNEARKYYASGFNMLFENVYQAENVTKAIELYHMHNPDILLVDINLPDGDGLELIKTLRSGGSKSIIIVLSAYSQREQLFKAIELNLFKYLIKPIKNSALLSVLNAAIKEINLVRSNIDSMQKVCNDLWWSNEANSLKTSDQTVVLSARENKFIELLMSNTKKIHTLDEIAYFVYEDHTPSNQAIKNLIHRLRKKVPVEFINNLYGVGYQLNIH